jgi:type II secretory pathway pseudopilin PulG
LKAGKSNKACPVYFSGQAFFHNSVKSGSRGIMLIMLLVVIAIISIMALAVLPFFGTVKQRAFEEDVENILEQTRRAVYMHALAQAEKNNDSYEGVSILSGTSEIALLGTSEGEKIIQERIKEHMKSVVNNGLLRKSGVMRNIDNDNKAAIVSAYDAVEFSIVHNLIDDSNFEYVEASGATGTNALWNTGSAENAVNILATTGVTGEFSALSAEAYVLGVTGETPNSYKNRDFRSYSRKKDAVDKSPVKGKFGNSSISIWNPPTTEVSK